MPFPYGAEGLGRRLVCVKKNGGGGGGGGVCDISDKVKEWWCIGQNGFFFSSSPTYLSALPPYPGLTIVQ